MAITEPATVELGAYASGKAWVTVWGASVPQALAAQVAAAIASEGYTTRPRGNTVQVQQDKNNMPSISAVKDRVIHHRDVLLAAWEPDDAKENIE